MRVDVRHEFEVVQFRLPRPETRLDQHLGRQAIWDRAFEAGFQAASTAEDQGCGDGAVGDEARVGEADRGRYAVGNVVGSGVAF